MRLPRPLTCAIALAAVLAVSGRSPHPNPPDGTTPDDRSDDRVVGTVGGPIVHTAHGIGAPIGEVWVWSDRPLVPGQRVAVTGRLRTPRGMLDPGLPDRRAGWELTATAIDHLGDDAGVRALAWRWAGEVQQAWAARIGEAGAGEAGAAALRGIVTGDRGEVPRALDQRWRALGIYHVLSVSGLHLAVVAGLAFALLRRLAAGSPWGGRIRPARWAAPPALVLACAYTLITGAQIATLRALIVIAIVLVAQIIDRPIRLVDALAAAALGLLAWRPDDLYDPSFQLSFVAALTLALRPGTPHAGVRGYIVRGVTASLWVAITTAPITAYHFHQVAAGGVIGNLVLAPVVELLALPLAIAGLALGPIGELGDLMIRIAAWLVGRVDDLAGVLAHVMPVGTIAIASGGVMAAAVALSVWLAARERRNRHDAIAWLVLCLAWAIGRTPPPPGALRVTFLDVGQGDAALIELPDGATWLVDAGGLPSAHDLDGAAAPGRAIAATLAAYGRTSIDLAIVSHPHPDHYLGLVALGVPVAELWSADDTVREPARAGPLPAFSAVAGALAARGTRLGHPPLGVARAEAGVELVVWAPRYAERDGDPPREAADPVRSVNDNSLVVALRFAGRTVLFAGDLEAEGEEAVVAAGLGPVDVVKVAHHGSPTSSSPPFVAATRPAIAVISCGVANAFHFPSPDVVARWQTAGADVERTDVSGAIALTIAPTGALAIDRFVP